MRLLSHLGIGLLLASLPAFASAQDLPKAVIDGKGPGFVALTQAHFTRANCNEDTWKFGDDGVIRCTGNPVGVIRTKKQYTNLELVVEWRHLKPAGNSGVFLWAPEGPLFALKPGQLPKGIEVQVLDLGYKEQYEKSSGKKATWFTCHGDVFPVGVKMKPFPPLSPDGSRSFPTQERSKGVGEWNHYYVRAINGEVRLWVNGEEVSGGANCDPKSGYLCLESEGSPVEFRNLKLRELP
ncbi:MAG: DUF1080 domain-containing protein [Planctomycetota bacterium]|nr:DUF1080 domain-containing protein [Planctomycetota bacterium]RLS38291.1 MAG: DUF1080 domain-containing protein [Planctomycetota bacterium]